jgi:ATP-dependent Clp protease ATP-binding subunit ClpA
MPEHAFHLTAVLQELEGAWLAEALFYPEVSCLDDDPSRLVGALTANARRLLERDQPGDRWRRRGPYPVELGVVEVTVEPPPHSAAWREPVVLRLPVLRWQHGDDAALAFVPALGIEVVAGSALEREEMLPRHVSVAILRNKARSLEKLVWLARAATVRVEEGRFTAELPTPKQAALAEQEEQEKQGSVLTEVGTDLVGPRLSRAFEMEPALAKLAEALTGRPPRGVLLVGPSGVGKTALVHELVRRRGELGLGGRRFWASSGARLVAGMSGFGMWQERCQKLWREASRQNAILHLGNLMELIEVGKSEHQSQGLATFLRPWLARGDLLTVVECTPEQLPLIERQDPHLVRAFTQLRLEEPTAERLEKVLGRFAAEQGGAALRHDALAEVIRLHRRYATYSASPGRPVRFLRNLLTDQPADTPVTRRTVTEAFARETGLPLVLLEDEVRLDLAEARDWFGQRVIGQGEAVDLVVDLLATVKAALNRPRKPIASLLFIGPTGVGKTEMAKALAEYLFGSRDRLTRFDMSEYGDPLAVQRLIGGLGSSEGILTAKVREQPFSVILLDEVEKADPQLFDLLLQVLGEGRLTDAAGRLADFCNSVVIMTSNLGAESYLQGDFGLLPSGPTRQRAKEHFVREVQSAVRPELFNRIDRIVPFAPLDEETTARIAVRELELLRRRDGIRYRGVTVHMGEEVSLWLAKRGYDIRYGARPLKRAIERQLLAPLSALMNEYTAETPLRAQVAVRDEAVRVQVRARTEEGGQQVAAGGLAGEEVQLAERCQGLRRSLQQLNAAQAALEVNNEIYRLERVQKTQHYSPVLGELKRIQEALTGQLAAAVALEDEALVALYSGTPGALARLAHLPAALDEATRRFDELLLTLFLRRFPRSERVSLGIFSEDPDTMLALAVGYFAHAGQTGTVSVWQLTPPKAPREPAARQPAAKPGEEKPQPPMPERRLVVAGAEVFAGRTVLAVRPWNAEEKRLEDEVMLPAMKGVIGIGLEIGGRAALPRFAAEGGLHVIQTSKQTAKALVDAGPVALTDYRPPEGIERRGAIGGQARRRHYRPEQGTIDDARLGALSLPFKAVGEVLPWCIEEALRRAAREVLAG